MEDIVRDAESCLKQTIVKARTAALGSTCTCNIASYAEMLCRMILSCDHVLITLPTHLMQRMRKGRGNTISHVHLSAIYG